MIAHLTDIHIGKKDERPRDVPVRENFLSILREIVENEPELLVLTGDLALDMGDSGIYRWIREKLESSGVPYQVLPGNHDDPELIRNIFGAAAGDGPVAGSAHRRRTVGEEELLLLDIPDGISTAEDVRWLSRQLQTLPERELLLFMHYPPVAMPVAHMEEYYALAGRDRLGDAIQGGNQRVHVFCGHYHGEMTQEGGNLSVHITPSTYFQIDRLRREFAVEHQRPAWRFIRRYEGRITTGVRYLEP